MYGGRPLCVMTVVIVDVVWKKVKTPESIKFTITLNPAPPPFSFTGEEDLGKAKYKLLWKHQNHSASNL